MKQWKTPDGRVLYKPEVSLHHVAFERRNYKTRLECLYRSMGGMILPLSNVAHVELHKNVPPPPKPNPDLMQDIYHYARRSEYVDQYDVFDQVREYVGLVAENNRNEQHREDAARLFDNLNQQAAFINIGRLSVLQAA